MPLTKEERLARDLEQLRTQTQEDYLLNNEYSEQWTAAQNMELQETRPAVLTFYLPTFQNEEQLKQRIKNGEQVPKEEFKPAEPIDPVQLDDANSRSVRKKLKAMQKQYKKALISKMEAKTTASTVFMKFMHEEMAKNPDSVADGTIKKSNGYAKNHDHIDDGNLELAIKAIDEIEKSNLSMLDYEKALKKEKKESFGEGDESLEARTLKFKLDAQYERIRVYRHRALSMAPDSKERAEMMQKIEEETLKADHLNREYRVARMPDGDEKKRDAATIKRHDKFDFLKKIFRKPTKYSKADAELKIEANAALGINEDLNLVNVGRATMGGTKAMYTFVNEETNEEWLFKEATNCIGMSKPESAVVTEEASRLQAFMRGELSIPAYCVKDGNKVVGSVQKKIQAVGGGVDLFKWQAQKNLNENPPSKTTLDDLMNEHTLDWLLCNFDTKGENFINQADGHIISFDKEASFNHLSDDEAQEMSYSYKPHSNDTIYNIMFKAFAEGTIDLDLDANMDSILRIEEKLRRDSENAGVDGAEPSYVEMFKNTLDTKYGADANDKRVEAAIRLRDRAVHLRETYRTFYTDLISKRLEKLEGKPERAQECEKLRSMLVNGEFRFKDEREAEAAREAHRLEKREAKRAAEREKIRERKRQQEEAKKKQEAITAARTELSDKFYPINRDFYDNRNKAYEYLNELSEKFTRVAAHGLLTCIAEMESIIDNKIFTEEANVDFQNELADMRIEKKLKLQKDLTEIKIQIGNIQDIREKYVPEQIAAIKKQMQRVKGTTQKNLRQIESDKVKRLNELHTILITALNKGAQQLNSDEKKSLIAARDEFVKLFDNYFYVRNEFNNEKVQEAAKKSVESLGKLLTDDELAEVYQMIDEYKNGQWELLNPDSQELIDPAYADREKILSFIENLAQ